MEVASLEDSPCPLPLLLGSVVYLQTLACRGAWASQAYAGPTLSSHRGVCVCVCVCVCVWEWWGEWEGKERRECGQWLQDKCCQAYRMSEVGPVLFDLVWEYGPWPTSCRALEVELLFGFFSFLFFAVQFLSWWHPPVLSPQCFIFKKHFLKRFILV